jgi:hypothetical protein
MDHAIAQRRTIVGTCSKLLASFGGSLNAAKSPFGFYRSLVRGCRKTNDSILHKRLSADVRYSRRDQANPCAVSGDKETKRYRNGD